MIWHAADNTHTFKFSESIARTNISRDKATQTYDFEDVMAAYGDGDVSNSKNSRSETSRKTEQDMALAGALNTK